MRKQKMLLALWASLICPSSGLIIGSATGGLALARVLFNDSRDIFFIIRLLWRSICYQTLYQWAFGMEKGIIMSTGSLTSPLAPGDTCPSSYTTDLYDAYTTTYCGADSYNGAIFLLNVLPTRATTFLVDIVIASCDLVSGDKVMVMANGVNYAKYEDGVALDSSSKYLSEPWGIPSPNGDTAFLMSSPPLRFSIPVPKSNVELKIAVCDRLDGYGDTAVMIKIRPCNDCDQTFKVDYDTTSVTSTTTYEATSIVTQPASGTARGTISHVTYVTLSAASATSSSPDSTSEDIASSAIPATSTFSTSLTASTSWSTASATASSAPLSCNEMDNPYQAPSGKKFQHDCNSYATGGYQIGPDYKTVDLSTCINLCATTANCQVALLDRSQSLCYLLDGTDGPAFNNLYDMATLLSSTPSTTESSETSSSTTSPPSTQTSLSCTQMVSSIYTETFTIICNTITTGESIYRRAEEDNMENCLAICDNDTRCMAINFYPYPYNECHLIESFASTQPSAGINFASKVISSSSTASASSEFIQSTLSTTVSTTRPAASTTTSVPMSDSSSVSTSEFIQSTLSTTESTTLSAASMASSISIPGSSSESTSVDLQNSTGAPLSSESATAISTGTTASIDTSTGLETPTIDTLKPRTTTAEAPAIDTSTAMASVTAINQSSMSEGAVCRRRRRSQR